MFSDPVCGREVHEGVAPATTQYQGVTLYSCSRRCYGKFHDNPPAYVELADQFTTKAA